MLGSINLSKHIMFTSTTKQRFGAFTPNKYLNFFPELMVLFKPYIHFQSKSFISSGWSYKSLLKLLYLNESPDLTASKTYFKVFFKHRN